MPVVSEQSEFLSILGLSKLLDEAVLESIRAAGDFPSEAGVFAEILVQQGILTRFQSKQLLGGRHRGLVLGPYRILDQIGKGGMGTVYLAEHATLKRRVAVKVLARELAENKTAVERFLREARAASALCHANIVRVHHVGQASGTHYIVMEHVDGATLEQVVDRKGPFGPMDAAKIAIQAASGLQHAHEKGFVHRDIKPENLMLTKDGTIKILDMGLTKKIDKSEDNLTGILNIQTILGTIDYLSPEQAIQNDVDASSDIYSLGATLFTLLTGHSPYEGVPAQQKLMQHQFGAVPNLMDFRSDLPEELAAIIAKMMAKLAKDRFASAAEVIDAFHPWTSDDDTSNQLVMQSQLFRATTVRSSSLTPTVREMATKTLTEVSPPLTHPATVPVDPSTLVEPIIRTRVKGPESELDRKSRIMSIAIVSAIITCLATFGIIMFAMR